MFNKWTIFTKAYNNKIVYKNLDLNLNFDIFYEQFKDKSGISFSEEEKTVLKNLVFLLDSENKLEELIDFIPFLTETDNIENSISAFKSTFELLNKKNEVSIKDDVLNAISENAISKSLFEYIEKNYSANDSLIYILLFSYCVNEDSNLFKENRFNLLTKYQSIFSTKSIPFEFEELNKANHSTIKKLEKILEASNYNKILNDALIIASYDKNKISIEEKIDNIKDIYETLVDSFKAIDASLKTSKLVEIETKEKQYA